MATADCNGYAFVSPLHQRLRDVRLGAPPQHDDDLDPEAPDCPPPPKGTPVVVDVHTLANTGSEWTLPPPSAVATEKSRRVLKRPAALVVRPGAKVAAPSRPSPLTVDTVSSPASCASAATSPAPSLDSLVSAGSTAGASKPRSSFGGSHGGSQVSDSEYTDSERVSSFSDDSSMSGISSVLRAVILRDGDWTPAQVDRTEWSMHVVEHHPEVTELRERLRPGWRASAFGSLYGVGRPEVKDNLNREIVVRLMMHYLNTQGLRQTRQRLEEDAKVKYDDLHTKDLRLRQLLRAALRDSDKIVDNVVCDKDEYKRDAEGTETELFGMLFRMGVQEEGGEAEDVPIWDEPPDSSQNIVLAPMEDGSLEGDMPPIKAATLNKLVERLTNAKAHDLKYMKTFLMTYPSFTTPDKLLQKLIERYRVPWPKDVEPGSKGEEDFKKQVMRPIQLRVCNVMKNWVEKHFPDFKDQVLQNLIHFLDNTVQKDHPGLAKSVHNAMKKQMEGSQKSGARETVFATAAPEPRVPRTIFQPTLNIMDVDEEEIARQLTCLEFDVYASIGPSELLNQAWSKPKLQHRSPNVRGMAQRFNQFSNWVSTMILKTDRVRNRASVMQKFIKVAVHLRALNNFNSLIAVCAGFNNSAVFRLKYTKEACGRAWETFTELEAQMSSAASYKGYREILHNADPPCVPYLGVCLTDLTFVEDGNPDFLNGLINFSKRKLVYNVILEIQQYQQRPYNLHPVVQIQNRLLNVRALPDNDLFKLSMMREPRKADRSQIL